MKKENLKDRPYFKVYVQDVLTDEKLVQCSADAHGVYFLLMLHMTKSEFFGKILLKQNFKQIRKQTPSKHQAKGQAKGQAPSKHLLEVCYRFASQLTKPMPFSIEVIEKALYELITEKVLFVEGDFLIQKRMVHDHDVSVKRSKSGSEGGKARVRNQYNRSHNFETDLPEDLLKQNSKQSDSKTVTSIYNKLYTGKKGGMGEKDYPELANIPSEIVKVYDLSYNQLKDLGGDMSKDVDVYDFEEWKKFVLVCASEKNEFYKDLFIAKFPFPKDFTKLKKRGFTEEKWVPTLQKILSVGLNQNHNLFFRIPDALGWRSSGNGVNGVNTSQKVKEAGNESEVFENNNFS